MGGLASTLEPKDTRSALTARLQNEELADIVGGGSWLKGALRRQAPVLPNLRRVVLGGLGDESWDDEGVFEGNIPSLIRRITPLTLLDLPALKHMCQYTSDGPLSLPRLPIRARGCLEVFTYHPKTYPPHSPIAAEQNPIVLGAINRYYWDEPIVIDWPVDDNDTRSFSEILPEILEPLITWLHPERTTIIATTSTTTPGEVIDLETSEVAGTTIEIYGFLECVIRFDGHSQPSAYASTESSAGTSSKPSLDIFAKTLDTYIHSRWRGHVILKSLADAPRCTACGLDPRPRYSTPETVV